MMDTFAVDNNTINKSSEDSNGTSSAVLINKEWRQQQHVLSSTTRPSTHWWHNSYRPWAVNTRLQAYTTWKRFDFWILFGSFACVTGCGLFVINNISTMVQSLRQPDSLAGHVVILLSICNVAGRILMGSLADLPHFHKISLFQSAAILMAFGLLISAISPFQEGDSRESVCLIITVAFVAIAYGGSWVLIVGILTDLYDRQDFGKDYGLIAMGPAVSGLIFNSMSASIYENGAETNDDNNEICLGNDCYRGSYWITATAAFVGCLTLYKMPRTT